MASLPLPPGWQIPIHPQGSQYFVNHNNNPSRPSQADLPNGWERRFSTDGREYFVDHTAKTTTWKHPSQAALPSQADLPAGWKRRFSPEGREYFTDHNTKVTTWDRPSQVALPSQSDLPAGWERRFSPEGREYFTDHNTKVTTWDRPSQAALPSQVDLPAGWERRFSPEGREYFTDHNTKVTTWDHPGLKKNPSHADLPAGWERRCNTQGRGYFVNHTTKTTTWDPPLYEELPRGWDQLVDPLGRQYFSDHTTRTTAWHPPPEYRRKHPPTSVGSEPTTTAQSTSASGQDTHACLMCRQARKAVDHDFCSKTCAAKAAKAGPILLQIPPGHITFESVEHQFQYSWKHPTVCPQVQFVYKVVGSTSSTNRYKKYRDAVEFRGKFLAKNRLAGNECRCWHGTTRKCLLGDNGKTKYCHSTGCSLCCILTSSFDLKYFKRKTNWGRFGRGIYTSFVSSKSNDYSLNKKSSPYKAIVLNKVVVGKKYTLLNDMPSLKTAPPGFDSVDGETGQSLNYNELVVYSNDAIRPSFLVIYG